jgi:calcium/calmodulin-dependent protein kinase I
MSLLAQPRCVIGDILLMQETTRAKVEFHQRYWTNISQAAKEFILGLLKPNPDDRMTAEQALQHHVSVTRDPPLTDLT